MFRFIQSRFFLQAIAVLAVVVWFIVQIVSSTHYVAMPAPALCWQFLAPLQNHYVSMCLVLAFGFIIQVVLSDICFFRSGFGDTHHLMVVFWFFLLLCCGSFASEFSPVWFSNIILIITISINFDYDSGNLKSRDLLSGILIGLATLFYPPVILVSFFVMASLIINRYSKYKDIFIFLLGIVLVYLYVVCFYFFNDRIADLQQQLSQLQFYNTIKATEVFSWKEILLVAALAVSLLYFYVVLQLEYGNKQVLLRKRLFTIHLLTVTTLLLMVFSPFNIHQSMGFMVLPWCMYCSMISQIKQHPFFNDIVMLIYVVALCL